MPSLLLSQSLKLLKRPKIEAPIVWLGQSVRTTVVTRLYPSLAGECWMASLGDAIHRPRLVERVFCGDLPGRLAVQGPIMLDSGGFTMMTQNRACKSWSSLEFIDGRVPISVSLSTFRP